MHSPLRRVVAPLAALALSLVAVPSAGRAQGHPPADPAAAARPEPVTIPGSERRTLHSAVTGRDYDVYVLLPQRPPATPGAKYPVLYLLDGQWDFKLLAAIQGGLFYDGYVPDQIVVGITYAGARANYDSLRALDYTPAASREIPGSGGGARFLTFLETELLPFVEGAYPADPARRALMGSSFGGLFTLHALFARPRLFAGYVAVSPAVAWAGRSAFAEEAAYARAHAELPARLFVAVGAAEPLDGPVGEFVAALRGRGYRGLTFESRRIADERHAGVKPEAFNRGLRFLFQPAGPSAAQAP